MPLEPAKSTPSAAPSGRCASSRSPWRLAASGLCAAAALAGCSDGSSAVHVLGPSQTYELAGTRIEWNATAEERHGFSASDFAPAEAADAPVARLHWTVPAGWTEKAPAPMRELNLQVAGDPQAECYLTTLSGEAGGVEANINRWRAQLSLPPLSTAEVNALPRIPWLGGEAVHADFEGDFTGMSGESARKNWRLVGLVLVRPDNSRFLKMIGPAEVVARELTAFRELAGSFHDEASGGHGVQPAGAPPARPDDDGQQAGLSWEAPPGWRRGPDKSLRVVTYFAGEGDEVECYVTLLGGEAGGVLANINRWCTQMGAPPLTDADVAGLERVQMAGTHGVLVRIERGPRPEMPAAAELLEGAVCLLDGRALFVKLTGPRGAVEAQHAALIAFCRSIEAS